MANSLRGITPRMLRLADEMHLKGLLRERLKVVAHQLIDGRYIAEAIRRARIVRVAQLNEHVKRVTMAMPFGTRYVDRARIKIGRLEVTAGLRITNIDDIAAVWA